MQSVILLFLLLVVGVVSKTWNCVDHFEGFWNVEKISTTSDLLNYGSGISQNVTLNLTKGAYDGILLGDHLSATPDDPFVVKIQAESALVGEFSLYKKNDEPQDVDLDADEEKNDFAAQVNDLYFKFEFHMGGQGMILAQGPYEYRTDDAGRTKKHGRYQYIIPNDKEFVLLLTPDEKSEDITVWTGRKFVKKVERAFFQRNGPVLMILVVVFGTKIIGPLLSGKSKGAQRAGSVRRTASGGAAQLKKE
jgi:hypothetical protein|eukprot:CAMPEP_0174283184 /NCGR_PEP_ID=MMETSP0809-20121228/3829_1 /TAXON_ID=73025 ORGANISM="Eutreptiella gymnastica-like, Strain CCMP1594" /NCGR_SAMPLE_ID=MMETSP0809 /ASSEMBLY_ACC=CAM_ASM_000658 /LENGTH=248 /DNA_ID=CAMNT_0015377933 /DNA_START=23 /DNA_END=769 /DNA_ORIENTATION=-